MANSFENRTLVASLKIWKEKQTITSLRKQQQQLIAKLEKLVIENNIESITDCLELLRLEIATNNIVLTQHLNQLLKMGVDQSEFNILDNYCNTLLYVDPKKTMIMCSVFKPFIDPIIIKCCNIHFVDLRSDFSSIVFRGTLADVMIMNSCLSEQEIKTKLITHLSKRIRKLHPHNVSPLNNENPMKFLFIDKLSISSLVLLTWCYDESLIYGGIIYKKLPQPILGRDQYVDLIPFIEEINDILMMNFSGVYYVLESTIKRHKLNNPQIIKLYNV